MKQPFWQALAQLTLGWRNPRVFCQKLVDQPNPLPSGLYAGIPIIILVSGLIWVLAPVAYSPMTRIAFLAWCMTGWLCGGLCLWLVARLLGSKSQLWKSLTAWGMSWMATAAFLSSLILSHVILPSIFGTSPANLTQGAALLVLITGGTIAFWKFFFVLIILRHLHHLSTGRIILAIPLLLAGLAVWTVVSSLLWETKIPIF